MRERRPRAGAAAVLAVLAIAVVVGMVSLAPAPARAQSVPAPSDPQVTAGILLVDINQVNLVAGTFNADFYLWFNSTGAPQYVNYELVNGVATSVVVDSNTTSYQEYRIRASFTNNLTFQNFPFDNHSLSMQVESRNLQSSQLTFVPDKSSGTDPSLTLNGWDILGSSVSAAPHSYSSSQSFSRLTFTFTIGRPVYGAFATDVLPVILIVLIAMLAFALPPARSFERVFIAVTTLVAAVQFHLALLSQIPPVDYLTVADDIMITVYVLILYGLGVTILLARQIEMKNVDRAWRLNTKGAVLVPVVAAVVMAFLLLLGYLGL
ncbi:MAG: hypothetical protein JRN58_06550 [Nitrososphaerota archaeon]|nr:hypothetical protein [Nitrososphaerota archaeon]MDG6966918.1 hypothetical protein [Nitrososphaerota archaeon]MDG6978722.1 hypothetical protein [Nitrososphaerota archaeon]